jgi:HEAT repeat protein
MLFEELNDTKNKALQGYLCIGLGLMRWTRAAETLRSFTEEETVYSLRQQASAALGLMGDPEAVTILIKVLENSKTLSVKAATAKALGLVGDRRAVEPLGRILHDPALHGLARAFAAVALGIIGEKTDLPWNTVVSENCNPAVSTEAIREVLDIL